MPVMRAAMTVGYEIRHSCYHHGGYDKVFGDCIERKRTRVLYQHAVQEGEPSSDIDEKKRGHRLNGWLSDVSNLADITRRLVGRGR